MINEFPLQLVELLGHWESYIVYILIGFAFGAVLEIAGFGNSNKLASQFYLKDMTVLKVMFTAIVVAMLLIVFTSSIGWLDFNLIWVNPTYLWPGIVGGLIMGFGFIIGGFCPGTSLVASATLKLDGIFFTLGVFFGIFLFGETVSGYEDWWNSSYMGRYTIDEWLGLDRGVVALGIVVMALLFFAIGEVFERIFGDESKKYAPRWRYAAAGVGILIGIFLAVYGSPDNERRWNWIAEEKEAQLANREVQIEPAELLDVMHNDRIVPMLIDVRSESDYNLFHISEAQNVPVDDIESIVDELHEALPNTIFVIMSNDENNATLAWKYLVAENVPNVYILGGGVNAWLDTYADEDFKTDYTLISQNDDQLRYVFPSALGDRHPAADPNPDVFEIEFEPKVKMVGKGGASGGGCG